LADIGSASSHGFRQTPAWFSAKTRMKYRSFSDSPVSSTAKQPPSTRAPVVQPVVLPLRQISTW